MSGLLPELDVEKTRARLVARKHAIQSQILRSLRNVVEAGVLPDGVRMFLFGSRTHPMMAGAGSDVDVLLLGRMTPSERLVIENALRKALPDVGLDVLHFELEAELSSQGRRVLAEAFEIKPRSTPCTTRPDDGGQGGRDARHTTQAETVAGCGETFGS